MKRSQSMVEFTLDGDNVRLTLMDERWVARIGDTVALGSSARSALTAALEGSRAVPARAALADLTLLRPSLAVLEMEKAGRPA